MVLHWPLFKAALVLASTATTLFLPKVEGGICESKREPEDADLFKVAAPNALDPGFRFNLDNGNKKTVEVKEGVHEAGLAQNSACQINPPETKIYGYAEVGGDPTWPGKTFEVKKAVPSRIEWVNKLTGPYILTGAHNSKGDFSKYSVVDTSLHWAYAVEGSVCEGDCNCDKPTIDKCGVPIVTHLHGGQTDANNDGNPEFFFGPDASPGVPLIKGPQYVTNGYDYANNLDATSIWYHDHALGITRLNVYAGLAGLYFVRDNFDSGKKGNKLTLPAEEYELAFGIQDRMFKNNGELLYPAFPGDPFYDDFIVGEGADLPSSSFPVCAGDLCGPTALAEFFGDHMVVNGKVWPFYNVLPRSYRLRLVNGCDSRFLGVQFCIANSGDTKCADDTLLPFMVIGGDQGFATEVTAVNTLLVETGSRYDIIFDFSVITNPSQNRLIMKNVGGDEPFGGELDLSSDALTSRIMAFNVDTNATDVVEDFDLDTLKEALSKNSPSNKRSSRTRRVALFEGTDEYGRLQPLLGTVEDATDYKNVDIEWPDQPIYSVTAGLSGSMQGTILWHDPTTENPKFRSTEEWEIFNLSGDAHPVHLHLVKFEVLGRKNIIWNNALVTQCLGESDDDGDEVDECKFGGEDFNPVLDPEAYDPVGNGLYLEARDTVQHNGDIGGGFNVIFPSGNPNDAVGEEIYPGDEYVEKHPKDIVSALPGQVTRIKVTFTKKGRYVWHCHILSHEDHEMMRVMFVGDPKTIKRNLRGADCEKAGEV